MTRRLAQQSVRALQVCDICRVQRDNHPVEYTLLAGEKGFLTWILYPC